MKPEFVVPYAENILPLLYSKETKTRWKAVHTLSFIAEKIPDMILSVLPVIQLLVEKDKSTIVHDFKGFNHVLDNCPNLKAEINLLVQPYLTANKKIVAAEAKKIIKRIEKSNNFYPIFTHSRPILSHSHLKNCVKPPFEPFVLKRFFGGYGCKCLKIR